MSTVKAIRIEKTGGPEVMRLAEIDLPAPAKGQIQVRHGACGINFIDTYQRTGLYPVALPSGLGLEAAGTVTAVGEGVTRLKAGDRIGYCTGPVGAYSQAANVPADRVVKLPGGIADDIAASILLKGMTAQYLLRRTYDVKKGETILFHAAAGGVGQIACQWARHLGATVIGTVGSKGKIATAKANGCEHVIVSSEEDTAKRVREITGGKGVPVAYDGVGKDTVLASLDSLAVRGLWVTFGNASGPVPPFEPALLSQKGSLYMTRPTLFHYTMTAEELQETADDLFAVITSGAVKIAPPTHYPLGDAAKAHGDLEGRRTTGSLVLIP
ncbi:MAG: NADPH:quinone reductase [Alphaproteobacteria bacterium]|nr:NADPH:quinone reductase [Alphaproteobacteria bacterium]